MQSDATGFVWKRRLRIGDERKCLAHSSVEWSFLIFYIRLHEIVSKSRSSSYLHVNKVLLKMVQSFLLLILQYNSRHITHRSVALSVTNMIGFLRANDYIVYLFTFHSSPLHQTYSFFVYAFVYYERKVYPGRSELNSNSYNVWYHVQSIYSYKTLVCIAFRMV